MDSCSSGSGPIGGGINGIERESSVTRKFVKRAQAEVFDNTFISLL